MFAPNSPTPSETPPVANAQSHSASQLHTHPLWQQAAGQSRGVPQSRDVKKRQSGSRMRVGQAISPTSDNAARYERLSILAVELQQGATGGDGVDSTILSSDDDDDASRSRRHKHDSHAYTYSDDDDDDDRDDGDDGDDDGDDGDDYNDKKIHQTKSRDSEDNDEEKKEQKPAKSPKDTFHARKGFHAPRAKNGGVSVDMMANAAFGANPNISVEQSDDSASVVSRTSSKRKRATLKQTFPVRGVKCVGCALANRIGPVERFVNRNVGRMAENALWKMASLTWKLEVVDEAKKEGVDVIMWQWRDIANHFKLHTTNIVVGRTSMIQSLTAMRCQVESRLVRVENGERELDKVNADLCLKVNQDFSNSNSQVPHY
jgi:hypothetical protein